MDEDALTQYVVYDRPRDHPDRVVVRPWDIGRNGIEPRRDAMLFLTLDAARQWLRERGLARLERMPDDDPVIVEVWL